MLKPIVFKVDCDENLFVQKRSLSIDTEWLLINNEGMVFCISSNSWIQRLAVDALFLKEHCSFNSPVGVFEYYASQFDN